jgi:hypothetical protein
VRRSDARSSNDDERVARGGERGHRERFCVDKAIRVFGHGHGDTNYTPFRTEYLAVQRSRKLHVDAVCHRLF